MKNEELKISKEKNYAGIGVSSGISIGKAYVYNSSLMFIKKYKVKDTRDELCRLQEGILQTLEQISQMRDNFEKETGNIKQFTSLLDAYQIILKDSRLIRGAIKRIETEQINAEYALKAEAENLAKVFANMGEGDFASKLYDIKGIITKLLKNLDSNLKDTPFSDLPKGSIILAKELSPADTATISPNNINAIASMSGGAQSHTAILARSLGLPAVVAAEGLLDDVQTGDTVIIDGTYGLIIINPNKETLEKFKKYQNDFLQWKESLKSLKDLPAITKDKEDIKLLGNIDLASEADILLDSGAEGIGLLRTEYLYMNKESFPTENELFNTFKMVMDRVKDKPITIRLLDINGDKISHLLPLGHSPNPALSLRGIKCALKYPQIIKTLFRGILRASNYGQVKILLPLITEVEEITTAKSILKECYEELKQERIPLNDTLPPLGIMIEVPSAAIMADRLAKHCDFFSIGSNDLIQYTLAVDRMDGKVAEYYNPGHLAVLRLIKLTVRAAKKAKIPVSVCGEMAGIPKYAAVLVGMGIKELSMASANIPRVKDRIRKISFAEAKWLAGEILSFTDNKKIDKKLEAFELKFWQ